MPLKKWQNATSLSFNMALVVAAITIAVLISSRASSADGMGNRPLQILYLAHLCAFCISSGGLVSDALQFALFFFNYLSCHACCSHVFFSLHLPHVGACIPETNGFFPCACRPTSSFFVSARNDLELLHFHVDFEAYRSFYNCCWHLDNAQDGGALARESM
jgi:hypothetical protein